MLRRNFVYYQPKFNIVYTSHYDLINHGIVTFSRYPVWTSKKTEQIKWKETGKEFNVPQKWEIVNGQIYSYFIFKDVNNMEIIHNHNNNMYKLFVDVNLVLLPVCVYENENKYIVKKKMRLLNKIFDNKSISCQS